MPTPVTSLLAVIASPGDTSEARAAVRDKINDWNIDNAERWRVVVLPWLYERHAVPEVGDSAQTLINEQAVNRADIVIAFFDTRLGTPTDVDVSGTNEEIGKAIDNDTPVHVYFSSGDINRESFDAQQYQELQAMRDDLRKQSLEGTYRDPRDLAEQVIRAIEKDIENRGWTEGLVSTSRSGAQLAWDHESNKTQIGLTSKGKPRYSSTNRLTVENRSSVPAEELTFELEPAESEDGELFSQLRSPSHPVTVEGHSEMAWVLVPWHSQNVRIKAKWTEKGIPREQAWVKTVG